MRGPTRLRLDVKAVGTPGQSQALRRSSSATTPSEPDMADALAQIAAILSRQTNGLEAVESMLLRCCRMSGQTVVGGVRKALSVSRRLSRRCSPQHCRQGQRDKRRQRSPGACQAVRWNVCTAERCNGLEPAATPLDSDESRTIPGRCRTLFVVFLPQMMRREPDEQARADQPQIALGVGVWRGGGIIASRYQSGRREESRATPPGSGSRMECCNNLSDSLCRGMAGTLSGLTRSRCSSAPRIIRRLMFMPFTPVTAGWRGSVSRSCPM